MHSVFNQQIKTDNFKKRNKQDKRKENMPIKDYKLKV